MWRSSDSPEHHWIGGEEKTREVFGDHASVYDFGDSIRWLHGSPYMRTEYPAADNQYDLRRGTRRHPLDAADLDEAQERKIGGLMGQSYQLITRNDHLDRIAEDMVDHFLGRGFAGLMFICIDKTTAACIGDKVQDAWGLRKKRCSTATRRLDYMRGTGSRGRFAVTNEAAGYG